MTEGKSEWISIEKRLPEDGQLIVVETKMGYLVGKFTNRGGLPRCLDSMTGRWAWNDRYFPLPAPQPEGKEPHQ